MKKETTPNPLEIVLNFTPATAFYQNARIVENSFHYRLGFVTVNSAENNVVRNPHKDAWGDEAFTAPYANLEFTAWISWRDGKFQVFGPRLEYRDIYNVGLRDAEKMVKMLRKVAKVQEGLPTRPKTFGQFVALMCHGLKVKRFAEVTGGNPASSCYDHHEYTFRSVDSLADYIDHGLQEFGKARMGGQEVEVSV